MLTKAQLQEAGQVMVDVYSKLLPIARRRTREELKNSPKHSKERQIAADGLRELRRRLQTGKQYLED